MMSRAQPRMQSCYAFSAVTSCALCTEAVGSGNTAMLLRALGAAHVSRCSLHAGELACRSLRHVQLSPEHIMAQWGLVGWALGRVCMYCVTSFIKHAQLCMGMECMAPWPQQLKTLRPHLKRPKLDLVAACSTYSPTAGLLLSSRAPPSAP